MKVEDIDFEDLISKLKMHDDKTYHRHSLHDYFDALPFFGMLLNGESIDDLEVECVRVLCELGYKSDYRWSW